MKFAFAAAVLAASVSSSAVFAAQELDPNVIAAQGSGTLPVVSPVPEADSLAMLVAGVAVVGGLLLRRRNKK